MRKLWILAPVFGLLLSTCSNEFEIIAPWKSIPVIYAMLSAPDTAHYVRIEKAFLSPDESALKIAQIADSIYYPENAIAVYIQKAGSNQRYQLHRVDAVLEGIVRDSGIFATAPNYLYKISTSEMGAPLQEGATYRVILERNDGSPTVTAETAIPGSFMIIQPTPLNTPPLINFSHEYTTTVQWRTDRNGYYFNVTLKIRYKEVDAGGQVYHDSLVWLAKRNVIRDDLQSGGLYAGVAEISGRALFDLLLDSIPPSSSRQRFFERMDITLEGGGYEISNYLIIAQANAGITGAEVFPTYTNVEPEGAGYGIVTAKNTFTMREIKVKEETVNALNSYTRSDGKKGVSLNFN